MTKNRTIIAFAASFVSGLTSGIAILVTDNDYQRPINIAMFYTPKFVFFCSALFSLSYCMISFMRKGLSRQFRKLLMRRHVSFCMLTCVCQCTALLNYMD